MIHRLMPHHIQQLLVGGVFTYKTRELATLYWWACTIYEGLSHSFKCEHLQCVPQYEKTDRKLNHRTCIGIPWTCSNHNVSQVFLPQSADKKHLAKTHLPKGLTSSGLHFTHQNFNTPRHHHQLVGGFNPFEKYYSQIGSFLQASG